MRMQLLLCLGAHAQARYRANFRQTPIIGSYCTKRKTIFHNSNVSIRVGYIWHFFRQVRCMALIIRYELELATLTSICQNIIVIKINNDIAIR